MRHFRDYILSGKSLKQLAVAYPVFYKTRILVLMVMMIILICLTMLNSCHQVKKTNIIKIGLTHSKNHSFTQALTLFGKLLEEETNGKYKVKVYHSAQLGSEKEMQEMLTVGSLEMTVTGLLNTYEPLFAVLEMPYLYEDRTHVKRVMESPMVEKVSSSLINNGVRLFGFYENGFRHITNSKRPINDPADVKGLLIRVPENLAQVETFKSLGAIPTPLSFSELYTALIQGVVDGQENPLQNIWYGRLFEAQGHIAMTSHIYNAAYVLMSNSFYESLPEEDKIIFRKCMKESISWQMNYMEENDKNLMENLLAGGMVFTYPDKSIFKQATLPSYEALYKTLGAEARSMVDYIRADTNSTKPKKVFYINSYHQGYAPSDDMMKGMHDVFKGKDVVVETFYMDTKRITTESHTRNAIENIFERIRSWKPDIVIASDDNAVKDFVVPYLKNGKIPVVFCGVNWSASEYNLPSKNVTGMLEVLPLPELIDTVFKYYPQSKKLTILSENTLSEKKNKEILDTLFRNKGLFPDYLLVDTFEDWKKAFVKANELADIIYLPTNGAISDWNDQEAILFIEQNIRKPVVTCDDFMMKFSVFGLTKVAEEQGEWAATKALEILEGKPISEIPLAKNRKFNIWLNTKLSEIIGFNPSNTLKEKSEKI